MPGHFSNHIRLRITAFRAGIEIKYNDLRNARVTNARMGRIRGTRRRKVLGTSARTETGPGYLRSPRLVMTVR